MKEEIKELRVQIDGLAQFTKELKPIEILAPAERNGVLKNANETIEIGHKGLYYNSKEIEKAVDSLYLAKAWLGKVLGELGNENPYKSGYKTKEDIEPTADKFEDGYGMQTTRFNEKNHIEKVDWLREEISNLIKFVESDFDYTVFNKLDQKPTREFAIARTNTYNHLSEARFWLGWELERIKNN